MDFETQMMLLLVVFVACAVVVVEAAVRVLDGSLARLLRRLAR